MHPNFFVHVPYPQLASNLDYLISQRLNPEVFFNAEALDALIPEQLQSIAASLASQGLSCTIHCPFMDLNPGSDERLLREATRYRFRQVIQAAAILGPRVMVFHPGYDRWRYGERQDSWLKHSIDSWQEVLALTDPLGCTVAVENIFEEEPSTLLALLEEINHPRLRHCFDVGHWHLFHAVGLEEWFAALGSHIAEAHIHDNHGRRDDHAPIGEGRIDFPLFFRLMAQYAPQAAWTIEAHSRVCLERALTAIAPYQATRGQSDPA
jgi:sugar phosphate isomerase/epimerase